MPTDAEATAIESGSIHDVAKLLEERMEAADTQEPAEANQEEPAEQSDDSPFAGESEDLEDADDGTDDSEDRATDEESQEDAEKWLPSSLDEIAEALEVPLEELLAAVKTKTKIDGQEGEASLADLQKSYQLERSLTRRAEKLAHSEKELAARQATVEQEYQDRVTQVSAIAQTMQARLNGEFERIDWDQLKADDPSEYMVKRQEFQDAQNQLNASVQQLVWQAQQDAQQKHQRMHDTLRAEVEAQLNRLPEIVPEWRDEKVRESELNQVRAYLKDQGYSDKEASVVYDARALRLARKAWLYDQKVGGVEPAKKRVRNAPKLVKPGQAKAATAANDARIRGLRKRLRNSGSVDDAAALMLERMNS